ncbi:MAG: LysR family transcriptional regulator [Streptococcaceae bacterium]|jgi:DNA-binding transcriptional LysR family regulator|nr:LysR family transcriptional regulator [Streptococcaceae bacterium]
MDIKHLQYFIVIVENNFNLTKAAELLYVSQPSLSKFLITFETDEDITIFTRHGKRLTGLTDEGKEFYYLAKGVVEKYDLLVSSYSGKKVMGGVKLGIPPVILQVLFTTPIVKFLTEIPEVHLQIVEKGAYELKKMLLLQEIDLAILITPMRTQSISAREIFSDTISVLFNKNHELALKKSINLLDLKDKKLVLLDKSFQLRHQIDQLFSNVELSPRIIFESSSWDLLVQMCDTLDVVTILPTPIIKTLATKNIVCKNFSPILPWEILMCKNENVHQSRASKFVEDYFENEFNMLK